VLCGIKAEALVVLNEDWEAALLCREVLGLLRRRRPHLVVAETAKPLRRERWSAVHDVRLLKLLGTRAVPPAA
jgi:hypothetical protein